MMCMYPRICICMMCKKSGYGNNEYNSLFYNKIRNNYNNNNSSSSIISSG